MTNLDSRSISKRIKHRQQDDGQPPDSPEDLESRPLSGGFVPAADTEPTKLPAGIGTINWDKSARSENGSRGALQISTSVVIDLRESEDPVVTIPRQIPTDARFLHEEEGLLGASRVQKGVKRTIDIVLGGLALLLSAPLMLALAGAIRLTSPGPALFRQTRVGERGTNFEMLKFRTMHTEAVARRGDLESLNEVDGPVFKIRDDPRITPVGRFLRRSSLDELPQLFHVLSGRMSLVGPRPPLPSEVSSYNDWELQRLTCKPGLTCIWQVNGRSDLDFETWMRMDIDYIGDWSPLADLSILARTPWAVLTGRGAY